MTTIELVQRILLRSGTSWVLWARDALRRQPDLRVVIHADGGVPHRRVIHVIDR